MSKILSPIAAAFAARDEHLANVHAERYSPEMKAQAEKGDKILASQKAAEDDALANIPPLARDYARTLERAIVAAIAAQTPHFAATIRSSCQGGLIPAPADYVEINLPRDAHDAVSRVFMNHLRAFFMNEPRIQFHHEVFSWSVQVPCTKNGSRIEGRSCVRHAITWSVDPPSPDISLNECEVLEPGSLICHPFNF
jgi:hypothetical protein